MSLFKKISGRQERLLMILTSIIIFFGIMMRLVFFLQNRNLFIDEANLARNIYERPFTGLLRPLDYEQYAAPLFLWVEKCSTLLFGYGEYAFRLYSLLAGIAALFVLLSILKDIISFRSIWYPLFLMAAAFIFLHYSSELKQYMSDVLFVLLLLRIAMKVDILSWRPVRFTLLWLLLGSAAIWMSMPAVFALAGVGVYYIYICLQEKNYKRLLPVIIAGGVWIIQFAFYYITVLKPQANSEYLQNFHKDYFLFLVPNSKEQLMHNWYLFKGLIQETGGFTVLAWVLNTLLFAGGAIAFFIEKRAKSLLFIIPVAGAFLAAALHQYSLIPRVALFLMPLFLVFMGYGFDKLMSIRYVAIRGLFIIAALICAYNHNTAHFIAHPWKMEEITEELSFLKENHIHDSELYVHNGARPAFIYYTQIHPQHAQWAELKNAHLLWWDVNYDQLAQSIKGRAAFIYTSLSFDDVQDYKKTIEKHLKQQASKEDQWKRCYVYIYQKQ